MEGGGTRGRSYTGCGDTPGEGNRAQEVTRYLPVKLECCCCDLHTEPVRNVKQEPGLGDWLFEVTVEACSVPPGPGPDWL